MYCLSKAITKYIISLRYKTDLLGYLSMSTDSQLFKTLFYCSSGCSVWCLSLLSLTYSALNSGLFPGFKHMKLKLTTCLLSVFWNTLYPLLQMVQISDQMSLLREAISDHSSHPNTHFLFFELIFFSTCNRKFVCFCVCFSL